MTVTAQEIADTLAGRRGAVSYSFRYERRTTDYRFLEDVTDAVLACRIQCDNNRPTPMTADFEIDPSEAEIDPTKDYIAVFAELLVRKGDGTTEKTDIPMGLFHLNIPRKNRRPGVETWNIRATDLTIFLIESELSVPYTVRSGTNYIHAVTDVLESLEFDVLYDLPETTHVTPNDMTWGGASKNKLDVANELLQAINYYPLWQRPDGVFTTRAQVDPHAENVHVAQRADELVVPPIQERLEPGRQPNEVAVIIDDPLRVPTFALKVNADESNLLSVLNTDQITSQQITSIAMVNREVAEEVADFLIRRAAAFAHQITLNTFPDFRRAPHEFYRVDVPDATDADDVWMVMGWSLDLTTGAIMQHQLGRTDAIEPRFEYSAIVLRDEATHYWRMNEDTGVLEDIGRLGAGANLTLELGSGTRDEDSLIGDGDTAAASLLFDGTRAAAPTGAAPNIWDGGGSIDMIVDLDSEGRLIDKGAWYLYVDSMNRIGLVVEFSGDNGQWREADGSVSFDTRHHIGIRYNADSPENTPVFVIDGIEKDGDDVTEVLTPTESRTDDSQFRLTVGV